MIALLVLAIAAEPPARTGLVELAGAAAIEQRRRATSRLAEVLRGLDGVDLVFAQDLPTLLGRERAGAYLACADDGCRVDALSSLGVEHWVMGELEPGAGDLQVRLRLVTKDRVVARVAERVPESSDLPRALAIAASELFPEEAARSFGGLIVDPGVSGFTVTIDEQIYVEPRGPIALKPGPHKVRVQRGGYEPWVGEAEVVLGPASRLDVDLERIYGPLPLILVGGAVAAAGVGTALSLTAGAIRDRWETECKPSCKPGFTREAYHSDESLVLAQSWGAGAMFTTSGALLVGAAIAFFLPVAP